MDRCRSAAACRRRFWEGALVGKERAALVGTAEQVRPNDDAACWDSGSGVATWGLLPGESEVSATLWTCVMDAALLWSLFFPFSLETLSFSHLPAMISGREFRAGTKLSRLLATARRHTRDGVEKLLWPNPASTVVRPKVPVHRTT